MDSDSDDDVTEEIAAVLARRRRAAKEVDLREETEAHELLLLD